MVTNKIDSLTSLRFFAAAAIFALHAVQVQGFPVSNFGGLTLHHGVSFFYVLSGFILHYNYRNRDKKITWIKFVLLRFMRIWPLHLVTLLAATLLFWSDVVSWYHAYLSPYSLASIIFLLHSWSPRNVVYFAINGVSWSISVEMFFYLCFFSISILTRRNPLVVLSAAIFLQIFYIESTWTFSSIHQFKDALYTINPISRISEFILGVVSAELWMRRNGVSFSFKAMTVAEICAVFMVLGANLMTKEIGHMVGSFFSPPYKMWSQVSLVDPFFAILICVFATGGGLLTRVLSHRMMVFLGEISFAAYLIHQPVQKYIGQQISGMPPSTLLMWAIFATVALSTIAHFLIEKPAYAAFSAWLHGGSQFDKGNNKSASGADDLNSISESR